jgi:hypothetical protein
MAKVVFGFAGLVGPEGISAKSATLIIQRLLSF